MNLRLCQCSSYKTATAVLIRFSSTAAIFRNSTANKTGLSYELDGTMRSGSHDMKTFGAGSLRALVSKSTLLQFLDGHRVFYEAMEEELDKSNGPSMVVWKKFEKNLRRTQSLIHDCQVLSTEVGYNGILTPSKAALSYARRLREVGGLEKDTGVPLLLGHFYTRYFADLFGGSMMGIPTKFALSLKETPQFYMHSVEIIERRREYVENIYEALNTAGRDLSKEQTKKIVDEAALAFRLNAALYREGFGGDGAGMYAGAALGGARIILGYIAEKLATTTFPTR